MGYKIMSYENNPKNAAKDALLVEQKLTVNVAQTATVDVNVVSPDPLPVQEAVIKDYFIELALGNITNSKGVGKAARSSAITNTGFLPIWGGATPMVFPTAVETWEIASLSPNDTLAGTGARTVLINYLDDSYVEQSAVVNLNGVTAVQVATDCFRPVGMVVIASGTSKHNEGLLTLQVAAGGNPRGFIKPTVSLGQDTYNTVPAGKTLVLVKVSPYVGKDDSGNLRGLLELFGANTIIESGIFPAYQNTYDIEFEIPIAVPEKSDFWYEFKSNNVGPIDVTVVTEYILKDNS